MAFRLVADFATADAFLAAHDDEIAHGGLVVRGAALPAGTPLADCALEVRIAGVKQAALTAKLASATEGQGVTVLFLEAPAALHGLAAQLRAPHRPAPRETLRLQEKMHLALSCDREMRFALLRDPNKQLHPMVMKNPRIGLDEVAWAARSSTLNPDALKLIAEHPEWGQNAAIAAALVRNAKTPVPVALKLLSRLPAAELRAIAKSQGRPQIVQAAKRLIIR